MSSSDIHHRYSKRFLSRENMIKVNNNNNKKITNTITISTSFPYLHFGQRLILVRDLVVLVVRLPCASWTVWLVLAGCVRPVVLSCRARLTLVAHLSWTIWITKEPEYNVIPYRISRGFFSLQSILMFEVGDLYTA